MYWRLTVCLVVAVLMVWLISPIILLFMIVGKRHDIRVLENLWLLRLELQRLADAGLLERERHRQLSDELDRILERYLRRCGVSPMSKAWWLRRTRGWNLLVQGTDVPLGPPPWQPAAQAGRGAAEEEQPRGAAAGRPGARADGPGDQPVSDRTRSQ